MASRKIKIKLNNIKSISQIACMKPTCKTKHKIKIIETGKWECFDCGKKIVYHFWKKTDKWEVYLPGQKVPIIYKTNIDFLFSGQYC